MTLEIYLDPKDPLAYLALPGTAKLLDPLQQSKIEIRWLPMQVDAWSDPGPEPSTDAGRGVRHRWFRASYRKREIEYYAKVHQLPLTNLYRQSHSEHAALALLWLAQQPTAATLTLAFLKHLTRSYWTDPGALMNSAASILPSLSATLAMTEDLTMSFKDFCVAQGPKALEQQLESNAAVGVIRGPAYRFADQLYIGREHLGLLATLISE